MYFNWAFDDLLCISFEIRPLEEEPLGSLKILEEYHLFSWDLESTFNHLFASVLWSLQCQLEPPRCKFCSEASKQAQMLHTSVYQLPRKDLEGTQNSYSRVTQTTGYSLSSFRGKGKMHALESTSKHLSEGRRKEETKPKRTTQANRTAPNLQNLQFNLPSTSHKPEQKTQPAKF